MQNLIKELIDELSAVWPRFVLLVSAVALGLFAALMYLIIIWAGVGFPPFWR